MEKRIRCHIYGRYGCCSKYQEHILWISRFVLFQLFGAGANAPPQLLVHTMLNAIQYTNSHDKSQRSRNELNLLNHSNSNIQKGLGREISCTMSWALLMHVHSLAINEFTSANSILSSALKSSMDQLKSLPSLLCLQLTLLWALLPLSCLSGFSLTEIGVKIFVYS